MQEKVKDQDQPIKTKTVFITNQLELTSSFSKQHPDHVTTLSKHHLIYSISGLIVGLFSILGGITLFMNGIVGSTSWTAKFFGAESQISDVAPGGILFIVGLFTILTTRYVLKIKT